MSSQFSSSDLRHFLSETGRIDVPDQALPRVRFLTRLVEAATSRAPGRPHHTAVECRRRPSARPCRGLIAVLCTEVPRQVQWECERCSDAGRITGWRHTRWDLAGRTHLGGRARESLDPVCVRLDRAEYAALLETPLDTPRLREIVASAIPLVLEDAVDLTPGSAAREIALVASSADLAALRSVLEHRLRGATHARRQRLRPVVERLEAPEPFAGDR